ncbi:dienelactone hydrolase family protein [Methylobacterium crusticola]|uniref:dienelactone hydrolase family protein n=1 Tax=Methylobacterium crusticola TaxID=1697972 RepID=UPI0034D611B7
MVGDVGQAAGSLRSELAPHAGVALIGFCLGGRLAVLAGLREPVDAAIGYYAVKLDRHLDELRALATPTILHFGETDPWVPDETVRAIGGILADRPGLAIHIYPGTGHGFAHTGYLPCDAAATSLAHRRTAERLDSLTATRRGARGRAMREPGTGLCSAERSSGPTVGPGSPARSRQAQLPAARPSPRPRSSACAARPSRHTPERSRSTASRKRPRSDRLEQSA